jgi:DNA-directed RNA polymerase specialized sigma24 family protein
LTNQENEYLDELLTRAKQGDEKSKNELCENIYVRMHDFVRFKLQGCSRSDVDDMTQEIVTAFAAKLEVIEDNPLRYAWKIAWNKINQFYRHNSRRKGEWKADDPNWVADSFDGIADPDSDFTTFLEVDEEVECIKEALKELSQFCQTFFLYILEKGGLEKQDYEDFWHFIKQVEPNLDKNAFYRRINYCRERLKRLLES